MKDGVIQSSLQFFSVTSSAKTGQQDFSIWVEEHGDALFRFAYSRVSNRDIAEDLVQDTFLAAISKSESFRGDGSVRAWLMTILRNKIVDWVRKRTSKEMLSETGEFFNEWGIWRTPTDKWWNFPENPEFALEREGFLAALRRCLDKLPVKQRAVIMMRAFDGLSTEMICKELEVSPSNEWVLTYRGRMALRECLEKNWYKKL